eukprot:1139986-Pelagomonas_calceolata.AAC.1
MGAALAAAAAAAGGTSRVRQYSSMQVPGLVEEEQLFSKLAFIKDERRNRLEAEHLNKWFAAKERRLAAVLKQPHQPRQPVVIEIDSDG